MNRQFDEFKDKRLADWKRVRLAIEHENTLYNHRITWLLSSQGFIIAALVAVINESLKPDGVDEKIASLIVIFFSLISMVICFAIGRALREADLHIEHLDKWWHQHWNRNRDYKNWKERSSASRRSLMRHPKIQGGRVGSAKVFNPFHACKWICKCLRAKTNQNPKNSESYKPTGRTKPISRRKRWVLRRGVIMLKRDVIVWPWSFQTVVFTFQLWWAGVLLVSSVLLNSFSNSTPSRSPAVDNANDNAVDNRLIRYPTGNSDGSAGSFFKDDNKNSSPTGLQKESLPRLAAGQELDRSRMNRQDWRMLVKQKRLEANGLRSLAKDNPALTLSYATELSQFGVYLADLKIWEAAYRETAQALEVVKALPDGSRGRDRAMATIFNNLGIIELARGRICESRKFLEDSTDLFGSLANIQPLFNDDLLRTRKNLQSLGDAGSSCP
jgi:hypothetical protein